jgi:hypothetical protein
MQVVERLEGLRISLLSALNRLCFAEPAAL